MKSLYRRPLSCSCLFLMTATAAFAQKGKHPAPTAPPPPTDVIAQITATKKIFLSNAGEDAYFVNDIPGGADVSYNELYASLKQWGRFELVNSPFKADLIFEVRGTETCSWNAKERRTLPDNDVQVCAAPMLNLSIVDPSTKGLLYQIVMPAGRGSNIPKGKIAFAKSINVLTDKIKVLVSAPAPLQIP
jgi:hypothetical protein